LQQQELTLARQRDQGAAVRCRVRRDDQRHAGPERRVTVMLLRHRSDPIPRAVIEKHVVQAHRLDADGLPFQHRSLLGGTRPRSTAVMGPIVSSRMVPTYQRPGPRFYQTLGLDSETAEMARVCGVGKG
jgi:hypothetical protein